MSLQDESFPHDELLELDLSPTPLRTFKFPHRLLAQQCEHSFSVENNKIALLHVHNSSESSSTCNQTISSAESATEQPPPAKVQAIATDEGMFKSDQTEDTTSSSHIALTDQQSFSVNNIHSEYTKRRYKHVESKVGQYIANIRNEDERRKRKLKQFQRHNSLPEIPVQHEPQVMKPMGRQRSTTIIAEKLNRALVGVIDNVEENDEEEGDEGNVPDVEGNNTTATTSATISTEGSSGRGSANTDEQRSQRESDESAEGVGSVDSTADNCIDKKTLALLLDERDRLLSYNDYQQLKLDEKQSEITRLRKNVDFLRVRLSNAEDQLKRNSYGRSMTLTGGTIGGVFGAGYSRHSLQGLLYCAAKSSKATQTDKLQLTPTPVHPPTPPPPPPPSPLPLDLGLPKKNVVPLLYVTPDTPDANNNMNVEGAVACPARNIKTVATIQPMALNFSNCIGDASAERRTTNESAKLRRRSNSLASRQQKQRTQTNNVAAGGNKSGHNSRSSHPSSSDSAIDCEVIDLSTSPKPARHKRYTIERNQFVTYAPKASRNFPYRRDQRTPSPMDLYMAHCPNSTALDISTVTEAPSSRKLLAKSITTGGGVGERRGSKRSLSRRWLHLFGSCIRCSNHQRADNEQFALQQTYTQVPLLETTFERSCVELRSQ
ncbi:protein swallow [Eurosta solidaginis]|uniref:protein swallow n=1 Tax=Eurosta solidaginis TaxID=178769 RepID=UPI0035317B36